MKKNKTQLYIYMYSGIQTIATNVFIIDKNNNKRFISDLRYIVEHVYEIIFPFFEKYQNHDIKMFFDNESIEYSDIEKSYYESITE